MTISLPCRDRNEFVANTAWFGEEVIEPLSAALTIMGPC